MAWNSVAPERARKKLWPDARVAQCRISETRIRENVPENVGRALRDRAARDEFFPVQRKQRRAGGGERPGFDVVDPLDGFPASASTPARTSRIDEAGKSAHRPAGGTIARVRARRDAALLPVPAAPEIATQPSNGALRRAALLALMPQRSPAESFRSARRLVRASHRVRTVAHAAGSALTANSAPSRRRLALISIIRARARSSSATAIVPDASSLRARRRCRNRHDLQDDRTHVQQRVFERNERESRHPVARGRPGPIVEWKLKVAKLADFVAILGSARRDASGLVIDDADPSGSLVAIEAIDESDERMASEVEIAGTSRPTTSKGAICSWASSQSTYRWAVRRARRR